MATEFKTGIWKKNKGKKYLFVIGEKKGYVLYYIARKNELSRIGSLYPPYIYTSSGRPKKCTVLHLQTAYWWIGGEQLCAPSTESKSETATPPNANQVFRTIELKDDEVFK